MFKLLFTLLLSVVVARWMYAETALMFPRAVPAIDYLLEEVQIPTHDQWSKDSTDKILNGAATVADKVLHMTGAGAKQRPQHSTSASQVSSSCTRTNQLDFCEVGAAQNKRTTL
jgi:hypothetical protein